MALANSTTMNEEIITKYIPLVKYIASRVIIGKSKHIEFDDLVSNGILGLMDALNKFDESKGMKFSSYASIRIKGAMIDELRRNSPIPKGAMDKLNRYNSAIDSLRNTLLREPTVDEIACEMAIDIADVIEIENHINYLSVVSLEELIYSEDDDMPLIGTIKDNKSPSPEKDLEDKEKMEYLAKAIELLNEKDKLVLNLYYYEGLTLKEIGKILEVSESRVCQLHTRAIAHLRKNLSKLKYK
ncbi:FliA/WhiG family RNA polymerase sigma factor [Clostridium cellulovorans]|uniref:RNA polymerase sigma factor n=1 Tax=Clostridium cellulovorans (strain ATCC 35296 / DSM 3052 / OCM 3 / 743B) TaxID=573061 RepID=D9SKI3_CLOC7|nr:FliA/WhiG family RNA polymerase sigma factor [Clostridium cellulovorans]ADL51479.1 RNA polymerase, sigma 28 subunit, FliA/WhiG [Clostridium cellulovorans 743B]